MSTCTTSSSIDHARHAGVRKRPGLVRAAVVRLLAVVLAFGCSSSPLPAQSSATQPPPAPSRDQLVERIRSEARRLDAATEQGSLRRTMVELPRWRFEGFFDGATPVVLSAMLSEGNLVREETHYLKDGKLVLLKVDLWWDVDRPARAPEPRKRHEFYVEGTTTVRHALRIESAPPKSSHDDAPVSADALIERGRTIARILSENVRDPAVAKGLENLPQIGSQ
jgi:hypothetical protein